MTEAIEKLSYKPAGRVVAGVQTLYTGAVKRGLSERTSDFSLSVKDFGAVGDGVTDDTAAIQACFDAALGPWTSPNGAAYTSNKAILFPVGTYKVSSSFTTPITGAVGGSTGSHDQTQIKLTVGTTAGLTDQDMVYVRGVNGVPNANASYGITKIDGTHIELWDSTFSGTFTSSPNATVTTPCLRLRKSYFFIYGGGTITTSSPNCAVLTLNGCSGSIHDMGFNGGDTAGTIGLDYNWSQRVGDPVSAQTSGFYSCGFYGSDYAIAIGMGQAMCSETLLQKCFYSGRTGLYVGNQNAISQTVLGGNFAGCKDYGIYVAGGSCPLIQGVGFQSYGNGVLSFYGNISGNTLTVLSMSTVRHPGYLIEVGDWVAIEATQGEQASVQITALGTGTGTTGTYTVVPGATWTNDGITTLGIGGKADINLGAMNSGDSASIISCRTESYNFVKASSGPVTIQSCGGSGWYGRDIIGSQHGFFAKGGANWNIKGCFGYGAINASSGTLDVSGSRFELNFNSTIPYFQVSEGGEPNAPSYMCITPQPIITTSSTSLSTAGDPLRVSLGCRVQCTASSAVTLTVASVASGTRMGVGSWIEIQQMTTGGQITFTASSTTLHSAHGLKTNGQYAVARLTCDGTNVYTVTGDTTT